jgi:hypothetical protein
MSGANQHEMMDTTQTPNVLPKRAHQRLKREEHQETQRQLDKQHTKSHTARTQQDCRADASDCENNSAGVKVA